MQNTIEGRKEEIEAARREIPLDFANRNGVWVEVTAIESRQDEIDKAKLKGELGGV